jgi:cytochrome c peroxidase
VDGRNGEVRSLEDAVRFYVERETRPERWYPRRADGTVAMYDDLPAVHRANVDVTDAPFNRRGEEPALSEEEIRDVVAFLKTLTDNYRPARQTGGEAELGGARQEGTEGGGELRIEGAGYRCGGGLPRGVGRHLSG